MSDVSGFRKILSDTLGLGKITVRPYIQTLAGRLDPHEIIVVNNQESRDIHLSLSYRNPSFSEDWYISRDDNEIIWHRRGKNISGGKIKLVELGLEIFGLTFGENPSQDYFYHSENPRIYGRMAIPVDLKRTKEEVKDSGFDSLAGTKWADPGVVSDRVGASPYQPFPAVLLSNYESDKGIVHGTLSQKLFYHNYLFSHDAGAVTWNILSSLKAISHLELAPGAIFDDYCYLGQTENADNIEKIFDGYKKVLRKYLPPLFGQKNANRHSVVWGSWNDGIGRDIDQERLFKMADFIKANLPTIEWMQIDDGYARNASKLNIAHGLGAPYEENGGVDLNKFPQGLKTYTDGIKERGVKPALWIGGCVPHGTPLANEHPDWFVDYSYRIPNSGVLDVSLPEVRDYMLKALDFYFKEAGFEGMKHDFWSYAFEDSHALLKNKEASGYQWRNWWLSEIRKRLPEYGYFQTGCDIVMGNPFLAEYFTNYRYGIDIGSGNWENVKTNFLWGAACFALHIGDLFVPNSDSIGLFPGLSDTEALFAINFCLISRSLVEVSGWLYKEREHPRFKWVKKALCCPNNGQDVYFVSYDYRKPGCPGPAGWYLKTPHFSLLEGNPYMPARTLAVFNVEDEEKKFSVTPEKLNLPAGDYVATDIWTLETFDISLLADFSIPSRGSRLFAVNLQNGSPQALDSNIKINKIFFSAGSLSLDLGYGGDMELALSHEPLGAEFNNARVKFKTENRKANWILRTGIADKGTLRINF